MHLKSGSSCSKSNKKSSMVIRVPESNSVKLIYITHFKNLPGLESLMHAQSRLKTVQKKLANQTRLKFVQITHKPNKTQIRPEQIRNET